VQLAQHVLKQHRLLQASGTATARLG
jgi:hypothetical protein